LTTVCTPLPKWNLLYHTVINSRVPENIESVKEEILAKHPDAGVTVLAGEFSKVSGEPPGMLLINTSSRPHCDLISSKMPALAFWSDTAFLKISDHNADGLMY
jgi:hypothetical protein